MNPANTLQTTHPTQDKRTGTVAPTEIDEEPAPLCLPKTNTRSSTILCNELDASRLKRASHVVKRTVIWSSRSTFEVRNAAEKAFWRAVKTGAPPALFDCEPPKPRIEAVRVVDMTSSNSWAEFAGLFRHTQSAHTDHERAKAELKTLMPEDAKEAMGHGIRAKRSKSGAISFDLVDMEVNHASVK